VWCLFLTTLYVSLTATSFARLYHHNVIDDAYISFQYARNLVLGQGLVFNPGQYVEGYTNFLWVVVLAPFYALSQSLGTDFVRMAIGISVALSMLNLALLFAIARHLFPRDWFATSVTIVLCGVDNAYLGYAISGLENHLLIFLSLTCLWAWLRTHKLRGLWVGLLLAMTCMTRPDAGLFVFAFVLATIPSLLWKKPSPPQIPQPATLAQIGLALGTFIIVFGLYFGWRVHYYDSWLPNTYYLKIGNEINAIERGWHYLRTFAEDRFYIPALALLALPWLRHTVVRWLLFWLLLHAAYVVYVGGDFYSGHRFLLVLLPAIALLIGGLIHHGRKRISSTPLAHWFMAHPPWMAFIIGITHGTVALGFCLLSARGFERGPYTHEISLYGEQVHNNIKFSKWLGSYSHAGESIVAGDIGATGFFTNLIVHDVYGVIDPAIARMKVNNFGQGKAGHEKRGSRDYLLSHHPTYVKWGYVPGDLRPYGYYVFTDFPPGFQQPGLWVREDLGEGSLLHDPNTRLDLHNLSGWRQSGNAFENAPTLRPVAGQEHVFGHSGPYLNSFTESLGDRATGTITSPPFELQGDLLLLWVGGGRDPQRLRVSLIVEGTRVASATGHNHEVLGRRAWNITSFKGKTAILEVVDDSPDVWGHIMVGGIRQWLKAKP